MFSKNIYRSKYEKHIFELCEFLFVIIMALFLILSLLFPSKYVLIILLILSSIYSCIKTRKNNLILVINIIIAYCCYSISVICFLTDKGYYIESCSGIEGLISLFILTFFMFAYAVMLPKIKESKKENNCIKNQQVSMIVHIAIIIGLLLILMFGYKTPAFGVRGTYLTIWGYFPLIVLIALEFAKDRSKVKYTYLILSVLYFLINLIHKERLYVIQLFIILCLYFFPKKLLKYKAAIIILGVVGYMALTFIGNFRNIESGNLFYNILKNFVMTLKGGLGIDTAASAFNTGITFYKQALVDTYLKRIEMLILLILSIFVGGSVLPGANLSNYTRQFFYHSFGGVLPLYGYYYIGFFGVFLFAVILGLAIRGFANRKMTRFKKILLVTIASTTFSWFLYTPVSLPRNILIASIMYFSILLCDSVIIKIKSNIRKRENNE